MAQTGPAMSALFISGCGDIGRRLAARARQQGLDVGGLARGEESARRMQEAGITPYTADLDRPESLRDLPLAGRLLVHLAPPPAEGTTDPRLHNLLAATASTGLPARLVLLSTTAVYGDCAGAWIDEEHPTQPQTARGRRRLHAEEGLRAWASAHAVPFVILRVGGIYGPGRLPVARLEQGLPILAESESPYTNRIHQDDLAEICLAAALRGRPGQVYNVADGQPGNMAQYFIEVARALGLPPPPVVGRAEAEAVMSAGMLSYLQESRRMDNQKLLRELAVELRYPDLASGLAALASAQAADEETHVEANRTKPNGGKA